MLGKGKLVKNEGDMAWSPPPPLVSSGLYRCDQVITVARLPNPSIPAKLKQGRERKWRLPPSSSWRGSHLPRPGRGTDPLSFFFPNKTPCEAARATNWQFEPDRKRPNALTRPYRRGSFLTRVSWCACLVYIYIFASPFAFDDSNGIDLCFFRWLIWHLSYYFVLSC